MVETFNMAHFEVDGWQLVHVVGAVPRAAALGPTVGQVTGVYPWPLNPVPFLNVMHTFTEFAAASVAEAAQPKQVGRGGGQHCDQCCVEPALPGHLQGERTKAPQDK